MQFKCGIGVASLGPQSQWKRNLHNRFSCATGTNIYVKVLCLVIVNVTKYSVYATEMSDRLL